jgi:hypothetical protein
MSLFFALVIGLPALGHAYLPAPQELLGLALDPELDPLVMEQMQEEDAAPAEEPEPTWEEDAALWEAANDPLVLDEQIFDENGNWIDDADTSVNFAELATEEEVTVPPVEVPKSTPAPAPTVQTTTMAPVTQSNGKPVLYRGGKVFDPGIGFHAAAEEEPAQEPVEEAVIVEEEVPSDTIEESGTGSSIIVEEDAMTGAVLEDEEALTATGALQENEEAKEMPIAEEEESSWLTGTLMSVALAGGAIALGVVLLVFKGKMGGMRRKAGAAAPATAATDVPAAPAPEESKLQQAIDEMRGKQ